MKASQDCRTLIAHYEGRRAEAYPDPGTGGAPWTIGIGHTGPEVKPGLVWTDAQIDAAFDVDILDHEANVWNRLLGRIEVEQCKFDALVSAMFNIGPGRPDAGIQRGRDGLVVLRNGLPSTLKRRIGESLLIGGPTWKAVAAALLVWDKAGGKSMLGLRRRRAAEAQLFLGASVQQAIAAGDALK